MPRPALSPNSSRVRVARTFAGAVAVALAAAAPASGAASTLACGDTLPAGHFVLETDLACASCPGVGVGLYLTSGAHLDMNGHSISFTTGGCGTGLSITGDGAHVENGRLFGGDVGIQIDGGAGTA